MTEISKSEIEKMQELRSRARTFWETILEEYFREHREYPPFVDQDKVHQFITLVSNRDPRFRQSVQQFQPIQSEIARAAIEVYNELIKKESRSIK